jgi:hypothetical protein
MEEFLNIDPIPLLDPAAATPFANYCGFRVLLDEIPLPETLEYLFQLLPQKRKRILKEECIVPLLTIPEHCPDVFLSCKKPRIEEDTSNPEITKVVRIGSCQSQKWKDRFQELCDYREKHGGHCLVPNNWPENMALAQWVKRQRYQYKLKQDGSHSTLTDERERALDNLGFVWDSHGVIWEERWNALKDFQRTHGHTSVPSTFAENAGLSLWVKCQRRQYKLFWRREQSNMTRERMVKLENLGFIWNPRISPNTTSTAACDEHGAAINSIIL